MTITNPEAFMAGVWDWAILDGCFGDTNIMPTDIDGFVERRGNFLVIETKHPLAIIPQGQRITLNALNDIGAMVIIVWGVKGVVEAMGVLYPPPFKPTPKKRATTNDFRKVVAWWFSKADRKGDTTCAGHQEGIKTNKK